MGNERDAELVRRDDEIAELVNKLAEAERTRDRYERDAIFHRVKVEDLREERDAAFVKGLERAIVLMRQATFTARA
jgi:predicted transcriptional regulator